MVNKAGRPSIFGGKSGGARVQGLLTPDGSVLFAQARHHVSVLYAKALVSDAETIDYLVRVWKESLALPRIEAAVVYGKGKKR